MHVSTAAQTRALDARALDELKLPGACLMQTAGDTLARVAAELLDELRGKTIVLACGKGNNGGDGFVAARRLRARGAAVRVVLTSPASEISGDAAIHFAALSGCEIPAEPFSGDSDFDRADLIVDCLLGTGTTGAPRGHLAECVRAINRTRERGASVLAADLPTGVDSDTGATPGDTVRADITLTFALPKPGLLLFPGAEFAGKVIVADLGFPARFFVDIPDSLTDFATVRALLPVRVQARDANKGSFGKVLVVAGSMGMAGASILTATAALRAGAGLVYLALPETIAPIAATLAPEVVLRPLPATATGIFDAHRAIPALHKLIPQVDSIALGPGLTTDDSLVDLVRFVVSQTKTPLVIDADGLALAKRCEDILRARVAGTTVLTPHPGEMAKLLGVSTAVIQDDRVGSVRACAGGWSSVALLKGARTLIATESGKLCYNRLGSVALATAGSGDILTGVIAALLSQNLGAFDAARAGAFLHARAGEIAEEKFGAVGVLAHELRDTLPEARRNLYGNTDAIEEIANR